MLNPHGKPKNDRPVIKVNLARLDNNETVFLQRELQAVDPVNYMVLYAGIMGRRYFPLIENVTRLDTEYLYKVFEIVGTADVGTGARANDDNFVGVRMTPVTQGIKQIPVSYGWPLIDIQRAADKNVPLEQMTVMAAMSAVARKIDRMLAFGFNPTTTNIKGALNNALVPLIQASNKTVGGTAWIRSAGAVAPAEILADISRMCATIRNNLQQASMMPFGDITPAFDRFTLLLDTANYTYAATTPRSDHSDTTIMQWAIQNVPWLEGIEEWNQCGLANAAGNGPRAFMYPRTPLWGGALIPDDFTSLNPQEEGHDIVVPASGSCGGVVNRFPVASVYMDSLTPT